MAKRYICKACVYATDECIACVPNKTPDDFDKRILNVHCYKMMENPVWEKMESYYETF